MTRMTTLSSRSYRITGYPSRRACLTYLVLQAKVDPNISRLCQQSTSMIGLASTLGSQDSVNLLLQARADVHPLSDEVPPLIRATWRAPLAVVQLLLRAKANSWQTIPVGALAALPWCHPGRHAWRERVCALQIAAALGRDTICTALLPADVEHRIDDLSYSVQPECSPPLTVLSKQATNLLTRVVDLVQQSEGVRGFPADRPAKGCKMRRMLYRLALLNGHPPHPPQNGIAMPRTCSADSLLTEVD